MTVELVRGGSGDSEVIGQAEIWNDLQDTARDPRRGSYGFRIRGRRGILLKNGRGRVRGFPRRSKNVWHLVARCLNEADFR